MFTGIVTSTGIVEKIEEAGGDQRFFFSAQSMDFSDVVLGDSIAVNGACLTATSLSSTGFAADVSLETLACTTLGHLANGSRVNLEKSLTPTTALGGHLVSGHVDAVGKVLSVQEDARSLRIDIEVPGDLGKYIATKGSVCVDGTSLTVNSVEGNVFGVNIIPHTAEKTLFGTYRAGSSVNIEVDLIARYVERITSYRQPR